VAKCNEPVPVCQRSDAPSRQTTVVEYRRFDAILYSVAVPRPPPTVSLPANYITVRGGRQWRWNNICHLQAAHIIILPSFHFQVFLLKTKYAKKMYKIVTQFNNFIILYYFKLNTIRHFSSIYYNHHYSGIIANNYNTNKLTIKTCCYCCAGNRCGLGRRA